MSTTTASPIEPADFPWYDYRGFTFSLGLQSDGHVINSGHSGSAFDPQKGKPDVSGGMGEQTQVAYAKQAAVLAAAGRSMADVTRVVENVTIEGLAHYGEAEQVRRSVFGTHQPVVVTVVVDRLVRRKALIEVEVHASPGAGVLLVAGSDGRWRRGTVREGHDGEIYLPTLLPLDVSGGIVADGDIAGQYAYCLERAGELLEAVGLSLAHVVSTVDYSTPATRDSYAQTTASRRGRLGPVPPASTGIVMSRLHEPGVLVALDVVASRHVPQAVSPPWTPDAPMPGSAAIRAGNTLYLSGFASYLSASYHSASYHSAADHSAADHRERSQPQSVRGLRRQAEQTYGAILETMAAAGAQPHHLLSTVEYITPEALPVYREVADVRRELLREPYPVSTGIVCEGLPTSGLMIEVVSTAMIPAGV